MSRITLSRWDTGEARLVVGWDHPAGGAFWTEFNKEPKPGPSGHINWSKAEDEGWREVLRNGGMFPGIPLDKLIEEMPEDLRPLMTEKVMKLLDEHSKDPDSGYGESAQVLDLT